MGRVTLLKTKFHSQSSTLSESHVSIPETRSQQAINAHTRITELFENEPAVGDGVTLSAWMKYFDRDFDRKIDYDEFVTGLKEMNYEGNIKELWKELDIDGSGYLSLDEIDQVSAGLWVSFQQWCAAQFETAYDMMSRLGDGKMVLESNFREKVQAAGWKSSFEDVIFSCIDLNRIGWFNTDNIKWFDDEKRKLRRKECARLQAKVKPRSKDKTVQQRVLREYKDFLVQRHGCLFRAWRKDLDADGSMSVQKRELFKACWDQGWRGDVRMLWRALDADDSGVTSLEELDLQVAKRLAEFKNWADFRFGSSVLAFQALDKTGTKKLRPLDLAGAAVRKGFPSSLSQARSFFALLNWQGNRYMTEEDFECLDVWKPPAYLVSRGNGQAAEEFKALLLKKYKRFLRAWRLCLDKDGSNRVSWTEFEIAARHVSFSGDVAGAWLSLDEDLSGFISFGELDPEGHEVMMRWKLWADAEFGNVRAAFKVFDCDGSGSLSVDEFQDSCREYGFMGNTKRLYLTLNFNNKDDLTLQECVFLDDWESPQEPQEPAASLPDEPSRDSHMAVRNGSTYFDVGASMSEVAAVASWFFLRRKARAAPALPYAVVCPSTMDSQLPSVANASQDVGFSRGQHKELAAVPGFTPESSTKVRPPLSTLGLNKTWPADKGAKRIGLFSKSTGVCPMPVSPYASSRPRRSARRPWID